MKKAKKIFASALWALAFIALAKNANAANLPDTLDEWRGTLVQATEFITTKDDENLGQWQNRVYIRDAPIASVEANLMEGPGTGTLFVPEGNTPDGGIAKNKAPLGFASVYETLNIAGKRAILERGDVTGQALAVALGENKTLTLETNSLSREELLDFAQTLIVLLEAR